ncbi:hypothetical protein H8E07_07675 [bacterium]|nr:hypothetical protein [bacterium]
MSADETRTLHDILWSGADHLSRRPADEDPQPAVTVMGALMLTHAALEAYLNYVGAHIAPEVWADEKTTFTTTPYRGVLGKLNWLCEKLELEREWGAQPWQSLKALDTWRNKLAHGKDGAGREVPPDLLAACTAQGLAVCRDAVRVVCLGMHEVLVEMYQMEEDAVRAPFDPAGDDRDRGD